jgi:hypothetical protein
MGGSPIQPRKAAVVAPPGLGGVLPPAAAAAEPPPPPPSGSTGTDDAATSGAAPVAGRTDGGSLDPRVWQFLDEAKLQKFIHIFVENEIEWEELLELEENDLIQMGLAKKGAVTSWLFVATCWVCVATVWNVWRRCGHLWRLLEYLL